jgi:peptidoglycan/LPS O-acetylase OafA/YrhL
MYLEGISLTVLTALTAIYLIFVLFSNRLSFVSVSASKLLKEKPKKRLHFFDFAKGLAIIAVLVIHVIFLINHYSDNFSTFFLESTQHLNRLMRFAIPVFFISSGALLFLDNLKKETLKEFYLVKVKRLILPYAAFSFFSTYISFQNFPGFFNYLGTAIYQFFTGSALVPYWFIPVLFQLYLIYPLLWYLLLVKKVNPEKLLAGSFIFSLLSYFLFSFNFLRWYEYLGGMDFFGAYLFFFVLGMVSKPIFLEQKEKIRFWFEKTKFFYFSALILGVYFLLGFLDPLYNYYNVRLIYGPTVMFLIFYLYQFIRNTKVSRFIEAVGKQSLYIYLIHFIFLIALIPVFLFLVIIELNPVFIFITFFALNFSCTYFFVLLLQKMYKVIK